MKEVEQLKLNKARATQLTQTTEATQLTKGEMLQSVLLS